MMRAIIYLAITVVLLLSSTTVCSAQNPSDKAKNKKSTIELFIPISHFFDGTQTNWLLLVPTGDGSIIPSSYGLRYSRNITRSGSFVFSALSYAQIYEFTGDKIPGETIMRFYEFFSLGYLHELSKKKSLLVYGLGEINMRFGNEVFHISYIDGNPHHPKAKRFLLEDIGLTAGLRMEKSLPLNFLFSTEVKYTRFILGLEEGIDLPELEKPKQTSPNVFTINLGLGYRF